MANAAVSDYENPYSQHNNADQGHKMMQMKGM